ncbi:hypothetical protein DL770_007297 [Monosporascus sp. CRB-9-2]|nr:hypothetical protein DL770_007297 [Monosporascus sp. CRB-9-2]
MATNPEALAIEGVQSISPEIAVQSARQETASSPALPPVTTGTSEDYLKGLALAVSRASATDPRNLLFQSETLPPDGSIESLSPESIRQMIYDNAMARLAAKIPHGAFVAEAAGFSAVACWEPESIYEKPRGDMDAEAAKATRPIFAEFLGKLEAVRKKHLWPVAERTSRGRFWHLCLMARDPTVPYVKGAVRALLVPFMKKFTSVDQNEGPIPVWLEAGSEQAKAVYAHFGFREVGVWEVRGIKTWGMIYTGKPEGQDGEFLG